MIRKHQTAGVVLALLIGNAALADEPAAIEPKWANQDEDTSPEGQVTFHGPFCAEQQKIFFANLPAHDFVRIEMDVLVLRSWDGSVPPPPQTNVREDPPDYFRVSVPGGPILLSTTFSNLPADDDGFNDAGKRQNFPSPVPGDRLMPQTGSTAKNSMGYHYPMPGPPQLVPMDATYHLTLLLPHKDATLPLRLEGIGLKHMIDESWGIKDAKLTPLTAEQVKTPDDSAIAEAFAAAIDATRTDQPEAFNTLVAGLDQTVAWIGLNVTPQPLDAGAVETAIADLAGDDNRIKEREAAFGTLVAFGPSVEAFVRDARKATRGEQRFRIERVLSRLGVLPVEVDEQRRVALATRVLEVIGTPAAIEARKKLVRNP
jgi:hypothetical protein